jgi:hypothetical protein
VFYECSFFALLADFGVALTERVKALLFRGLDEEGVDVDRSAAMLATPAGGALANSLLRAGV